MKTAWVEKNSPEYNELLKNDYQLWIDNKQGTVCLRLGMVSWIKRLQNLRR